MKQTLLATLTPLLLFFLLINCTKETNEAETFCWECNAYYNGQLANSDTDCEENSQDMNQRMSDFKSSSALEYNVVCNEIE